MDKSLFFKCDDILKEKLISKLRHKYILNDGDIGNNLMWARFKMKFEVKNIKDLEGLDIKNPENIYFYLERQKELYQTKLSDILIFIQKMEPWEEIDAYLFDRALDWIVAITHEDDIILTIGL